MPSTVFGCQGQVDEGLDRPVRAEQGVDQLEQGIPAGGQAVVEAGPETGKRGQGLDADSVFQQNRPHGLGW